MRVLNRIVWVVLLIGSVATVGGDMPPGALPSIMLATAVLFAPAVIVMTYSLILLAASELIRVILDIQKNTHGNLRELRRQG